MEIVDDRKPGSEMLFLLLVVGGITHVLVLLLGLTVAGGPHTPLWEMAFSVVSITSILLKNSWSRESHCKEQEIFTFC